MNFKAMKKKLVKAYARMFTKAFGDSSRIKSKADEIAFGHIFTKDALRFHFLSFISIRSKNLKNISSRGIVTNPTIPLLTRHYQAHANIKKNDEITKENPLEIKIH